MSVTFKATKRTPRRVRVSFRSDKGRKVVFVAVKRVPKKVPIKFYRKIKE